MGDQWADLRAWLDMLREEEPIPGDTLEDDMLGSGAFANALLARLMEEQPLDDRLPGDVSPLPHASRGGQPARRVRQECLPLARGRAGRTCWPRAWPSSSPRLGVPG